MEPGDREVYGESIRVESKVFYIDLKENARGRYLKLSEKGANRPRSTLILPVAGLSWFIKLFDYYLQQSVENKTPLNKELAVENKVFYFSVGENPRGKFLRISESGLGHPVGRSSLVIPSAGPEDAGWATFRDSIQRVRGIEGQPHEEPHAVSVDGTQSVVGPGPSPPVLSQSSTGAPVLRVGQKKYFFDLGENDKGKYLRITEVVREQRSSLFVSSMALPKFVEALTTVMSTSSS